MFGFIKKMFVVVMTFFSCNALICVSMNNQDCRIRPGITNINSNEPKFYRYGIEANKYSAAAIILMIHIQNHVFLMLLKT